MARSFLLLWLIGPASLCAAAEAPHGLPRPEFTPQPSDPAWLVQAVQLHGHLGPTVIAGARMGMAGLRVVEAKGYFDVEVLCEGPFAKPPQACFLDGLQVGTGATLGKRTLQWVEGERILVRVKNTKTGKTVALRPTQSLLGLLASVKPEPRAARPTGADHQAADERLEAVARRIASMPEGEIITTEQGQ